VGTLEDSARKLRDAASVAHRRGDTEAAVSLYESILDQFPDSAEAVDAVFYLSSIGKRSKRRPPRRVE